MSIEEITQRMTLDRIEWQKKIHVDDPKLLRIYSRSQKFWD